MFSDTEEEWLDILLGSQGEKRSFKRRDTQPNWQCLSIVQCTNILYFDNFYIAKYSALP